MSNRDAFESALAQHLVGYVNWAPDYLAAMRLNDEFYTTSEPVLTAIINAAWWAWNHGQRSLMGQAEGRDHVMH